LVTNLLFNWLFYIFNVLHLLTPEVLGVDGMSKTINLNVRLDVVAQVRLSQLVVKSGLSKSETVRALILDPGLFCSDKQLFYQNILLEIQKSLSRCQFITPNINVEKSNNPRDNISHVAHLVDSPAPPHVTIDIPDPIENDSNHHPMVDFGMVVDFDKIDWTGELPFKTKIPKNFYHIAQSLLNSPLLRDSSSMEKREHELREFISYYNMGDGCTNTSLNWGRDLIKWINDNDSNRPRNIIAPETPKVKMTPKEQADQDSLRAEMRRDLGFV
jgi:hypothetical protein